MVTIQDSSLRANVYETIYDSINGVASWGLSSSNTVTVTASYVDGQGDPPLPQVVIHPIEVSSNPANFDHSLRDREIRVRIEVFSNKKKDLDQISDKICDTVESLSTPGMQLADTDENNAVVTGPSKIHSKALSFTYRRRS